MAVTSIYSGYTPPPPELYSLYSLRLGAAPEHDQSARVRGRQPPDRERFGQNLKSV